MPRRRGKRRRYYRGPGNLPKRPLVSCCQESDQPPETPSVTALEHLAQVMPPELLSQLQTQPPHRWYTRTKSNAILPSLSLDSPSFCIGRVTLFLDTGASLRDLLSCLRLLHPKVNYQLYLMTGFLELLFDESESFYLPISVIPPLPTGCLKSSGLYVTQLVMKTLDEGEVGGGRGEAGSSTECHTSDSGLGESDSGRDVEKDVHRGGSVVGGLGTGEEGVGLGDVRTGGGVEELAAGVLTGGRENEEDCGRMEGLVEGEGCGGGSVNGGGGDGGSVVMGGGEVNGKGGGGVSVNGEGGDGGSVVTGGGEVNGEGGSVVIGGGEVNGEGGGGGSVVMGGGGLFVGGVSVEVWVGGGEVCEPGDPNALPPHGNVPRLMILMKVVHPRPFEEITNSWPAYSGHHWLTITARIDQFYRDVKQKSNELYGEKEYDTSLIPGLTAELRGYQRKAVQWMLERERGLETHEDRPSQLHLLWRELKVPNCGPLYFNPYTGRLTSERHSPPRPPLGGILADEMGLGKTVEVLALLMAHRAPLLPPNTTPETPLSLTNRGDSREQATSANTSYSPEQRVGGGEDGVEGEKGGGGGEGGEAAAAVVEEEEEVVQCVCGATSETGEGGSEYVRCEKCGFWLHSHCVSFNSSRHSSFICIKCLLEEPLQSRATLIISPQTILQQWREEIEKHTSHNALSVMHYEGVRCGFVSPYELADCDVVLVSYETLSLELNYAKSHEVSRVLRYRKRYSAAPSPLPAVYWWRVCLDEAQMVESAVTKPAEMCLRLQTHHRWCVTGTPIQRDLHDLYGLVLFLDAEPYCQSHWYRRLITQPYVEGNHTPLVRLFSSLMWRNSKNDVAQELQLPEQTEETHWLTFSLVEKYFYRKQREMCRTEASKVLSRLGYNYTLSSLTQDTVQKIMIPLHSLRRACCHPQMVRRGGYIPVNHKKSLTMPQLLDKLTVQAKVEAREGLRKSILSLNGLAGLYILKVEWRKALETYEQAINMWREYKEKEVECDRLQKIHTLENLAWLLEEGYCSPEELSGPWRNAGTLREKAGELRGQVLGKTESQVKTAALAVMSCKQSTRNSWDQQTVEVPSPEAASSSSCTSAQDNQDNPADTCNQDTSHEQQDISSTPDDQDSGTLENQDTSSPDLTPMDTTQASSQHSSTAIIWEEGEDKNSITHLMDWVGVAIQWVERRVGPDVVEQLIATINSHLLESSQLMLGSEVSGRITNISTIPFITILHLRKLEDARTQSLWVLQSLLPPPRQWAVEQAYHCHLALSEEERRGSTVGFLACDVCKAETVLVQYGSQLFNHYSHTNSMGLEHGEGARGAHAFENIVRSFLTFLRHRRAPKEILDAGKALVAYIEAVKKEYDVLRGLWQSLGHRMGQYDELRLATSRMRYMTPSELMDGGTADMSAVHPMLWAAKKEEFEGERILAKNELTRSLGQVVYLKNLAKTPVSDTDCENCPICTRELGKEIDEWGILPCGHPLCMECVLELSRRAYHTPWQSRGGVTARLSCPLCRFSFLSSEINTVRPNESEDMGNLSTKIRGVVQTLRSIQNKSPTAKTLVFSYWAETLELVSTSLTEFGIAHSFVKTPKTFQDNLSEFKKSTDVNVLLMPLHSGSKGLNIVEATHVVLVEPGLNVGAELQAIGRIHRMGQTKPTTVHRLVIRDSVEEKIHHLLNSSSHTNNKFHTRKEGESTLTLRELEALFN